MFEDLIGQLAVIDRTPANGQAIRNFTEACARADSDPAEKQRVRDIADLTDAEDLCYEQAVGAAEAGDHVRALPLLRLCAEAGIGEADWYLASTLDALADPEAARWFERAAARGDTRAADWLASRKAGISSGSAAADVMLPLTGAPYCHPDTTIDDLTERLLRSQTGALLVIDGSQVTGMVTLADAAECLHRNRGLPSIQRAETLMRPAATVPAGLPVADALTAAAGNPSGLMVVTRPDGTAAGYLTVEALLNPGQQNQDQPEARKRGSSGETRRGLLAVAAAVIVCAGAAISAGFASHWGPHEYAVQEGYAIDTTIRFSPGQSTLSASARSELTSEAASIKTSGVRATITGYADDRGSTEGDLRLSKERARAVADFLTGKGVATSRLQVEAKVTGPGPADIARIRIWGA